MSYDKKKNSYLHTTCIINYKHMIHTKIPTCTQFEYRLIINNSRQSPRQEYLASHDTQTIAPQSTVSVTGHSISTKYSIVSF